MKGSGSRLWLFEGKNWRMSDPGPAIDAFLICLAALEGFLCGGFCK